MPAAKARSAVPAHRKQQKQQHSTRPARVGPALRAWPSYFGARRPQVRTTTACPLSALERGFESRWRECSRRPPARSMMGRLSMPSLPASGGACRRRRHTGTWCGS
eukprot:5777080-Prymnesium_polylepis.1